MHANKRLEHLTLEQKMAQRGYFMVTDLMTDGVMGERKLREQLGSAVGQLTRPAALSGQDPCETDLLTKQIQQLVLEPKEVKHVIGSASDHIRLSSTYHFTGKVTIFDQSLNTPVSAVLL